MLSALKSAKVAGASVVSINPLYETGMKRFKHPQDPLEVIGQGTKIADLHIPVNVNGDMALFRGLAKSIISGFGTNPEFIQQFTHGFEEAKKQFQTPVGKKSHLHAESKGYDIEKLAAAMRDSKSTIVCWAMGLTQHQNSVATIQEIVNTLLLGGHIGKPGAGLCPVRGHSNVQGDRTVGINHKPSNGFLSSLRNTYRNQTTNKTRL